MPSAIVVGGGLAGMAAATALASAGFRVDVLEARSWLGGRAGSFPLPGQDGPSGLIDNCQHVLLGCCVNLLDFYRRLGVGGRIRFHEEYYFLEPGGRLSVLRPGVLPAPLHFTGSFFGLSFLDFSDKVSIARGLAAVRRDWARPDRDRITMLEWLREQRQTPRAIERFWRPVLVSAVNEEPDRTAAGHGLQVFRLGFLGSPEASRMGVPDVPLGELYSPEIWGGQEGVTVRLRTPVSRVSASGGAVSAITSNGEEFRADYCVCALPPEAARTVVPELGLDTSGFSWSPITGIHLWFDSAVTALPHAALLGRTIQWFFGKDGGRRLLVVVSASRDLAGMDWSDVVGLARRELEEFLPAASCALLERAHVVKEMRATFSARPGLEALRPAQTTALPNLFLAGDWTRTGWPATMEGAVRSGYLAAEAVTRAAGRPARFLIPDPA